MPYHKEQQFSPYTPQQLFDLVADVEKYPKFLPWCKSARIIQQEADGFTAELTISFAHISESYISRVVLIPPQDGAVAEIIVSMVKGPFEYLINNWKFTQINGGTRIDFVLDFKFKSRILEKLIGSLFGKATAKMVSAFKQRAITLYGI